MATRNQMIRKWSLPVLLAAFVLGFAALALASGWQETLAQIEKISLTQLLALLGFSLVNYFARAVRWHSYTAALALGTGFVQDVRHYLGGFALTITPGRVGELIRLRWITRETGQRIEDAAPLVLIDRAADVLSVGLVLAVSLGFSTTGITGGIPVAAGAVALAVVATRPRLFRWLVTATWRTFGLFPRLFARMRRAAGQLQVFSRRRVFLPAVALGAIGWLAEASAFALLLDWLDAPLPYATAVSIFLFAMLTGGASGLPGGLGGAEAAMIALLSLQQMPFETALAATTIIRATTLWFAILIGIGVFPLAERRAERT